MLQKIRLENLLLGYFLATRFSPPHICDVAELVIMHNKILTKFGYK